MAAPPEYANIRRRLYRRVRRIVAEGDALSARLRGGDEIRRVFGREATGHLRKIVRLGGHPQEVHLVVMLRDTIWTELKK